MVQAPWASTLVAIALIPVAILFTHAYLSGRRGWRHHMMTGMLAVVGDLSLSTFYMIYRLVGGQADGGVLSLTPTLTAYFAVHGTISAVVIALEIVILATGLLQWRRKKAMAWHRKISLPLYLLWFIAFLSGELVYLAYYVLS